MDDYEITEKDIQTVIDRLKIEDPANADRDYAIQLLEAMQDFAGDSVRSNIESADSFKQALDKMKSED